MKTRKRSEANQQSTKSSHQRYQDEQDEKWKKQRQWLKESGDLDNLLYVQKLNAFLTEVIKDYRDFPESMPRTFHDVLRAITRTGDQAAWLRQMLYWFGDSNYTNRPRASKVRDGKLWVYKTYEEIASELSITPRQAKHVVAGLVQLGYLESRRMKVGKHKTSNHYRPIGCAIHNALVAAKKKEFVRHQQQLYPS
jgi:hypothetical protein